MNHTIIYHANCVDGFTSAWVVRKYLLSIGTADSNMKFIALDYANRDSFAADFKLQDKDSTMMYVVDFSFTPEQVNTICNNNLYSLEHMSIIDHHKTAIEEWEGAEVPDKVYLRLNEKYSGASLCWNTFFLAESTPTLVQLVADRDLWQFKLPNSRTLSRYIATVPKNFEAYTSLYIELEDRQASGSILRRAEMLEQQYEASVKEAVDKAYEINFYGYKGLATNCAGSLASDVGNELCKQSGTFGLTWFVHKGSSIKVSLRSEGSYDVSNIAKIYGGGGHKNAAGLILPITDLIKVGKSL